MLFVRPALRALQGASPLAPREPVALAEPVRRGREREEAIRVALEADEAGPPRARPTGPQGSHSLSSLVGADALAFIPPGEGALAAGAVVQAERL